MEINSALIAGLIAAAFMTILTSLMPFIGMPKMNINCLPGAMFSANEGVARITWRHTPFGGGSHLCRYRHLAMGPRCWRPNPVPDAYLCRRACDECHHPHAPGMARGPPARKTDCLYQSVATHFSRIMHHRVGTDRLYQSAPAPLSPQPQSASCVPYPISAPWPLPSR